MRTVEGAQREEPLVVYFPDDRLTQSGLERHRERKAKFSSTSHPPAYEFNSESGIDTHETARLLYF